MNAAEKNFAASRRSVFLTNRPHMIRKITLYGAGGEEDMPSYYFIDEGTLFLLNARCLKKHESGRLFRRTGF